MTLTAEHKATLRDIEVKDGNCYLNRNKEWPIPLSHGWTPGDLYSLIPAYAQEYDVNVVKESHVKTIVDRYVLTFGNGKAKKKNVDDEEPKSHAELLMDLAAENIQQLFKDQYGFAHAVIRIADHNEVLPVENSRFKRYMAKLFWDRYQKVVGSESITNATTILQARAEYESETFPLNLRVAWYLNAIHYDLTDDAWRSVRIDRLGWRVEPETPLLFTRYKGAVAQVEPNQAGDITLDDFLGLTNVTDPNHKLLVKVYIASLFIPDIPHVILNLYGDKGSAKSMLYTLIKSLVDPSKPALLTLHKDRNEFIQQLSHNWVAFYDNAKHVPEWLSDEACRGATGGGHTKRRLYSDDEDFIYDFKRCLGFNGINISLTEEDALDRSIMIDLVRIPNDKRRLETDILASFEVIKARLLGYIFYVLSSAIDIHSTIQLSDKPRMADFAQWGQGIARALKAIEENGLEDGERAERFDWMSDKFQLICREYRQSLGLVNMENFESKSETVSERRYWAELYRVRGYGIYEGKTRYSGQDIILEVMPDPPEEFVMNWLQQNDIKTQTSEPDSPEQYQERLRGWEERIRID